MNTTLKEKNQAIDMLTIQRILNGETNAFSVIYDRYREHIYNKFVSYLRVEADAEDATMLALTKVYENISKYEEKYTFNAWVTRLAHNVLIDYYRKNNLHEGDLVSIDKVAANDNIKSDSAPVFYQLPDSGLNPEQKAIKYERDVKLLNAVNSLKDKYREALTLVYFDDCSYDEAAAVLDMKLSNFKVTVHRAKKELKKVMEGRI